MALFTPEAFPLEMGQAFAAPFWVGGSTSSRGHVWHRQSHRPELLQQAAQDLACASPAALPPHTPFSWPPGTKFSFGGPLAPR